LLSLIAFSKTVVFPVPGTPVVMIFIFFIYY
jgi:hypothetical protein